MTPPDSGLSAFQLSRVYSEGWNAAKKLLAATAASGDAQSAKLNPYGGGEERARWTKGFQDAARSRTGSHCAPSRGWNAGSKSHR